MAIEIDEPTFLETFLHYGLLIGAAFQLICIFAVIFIPQSESDKERFQEESRTSVNTGQSLHQTPSHVKKPKKEKKKFR